MVQERENEKKRIDASERKKQVVAAEAKKASEEAQRKKQEEENKAIESSIFTSFSSILRPFFKCQSETLNFHPLTLNQVANGFLHRTL